jgi:hypothetical protein
MSETQQALAQQPKGKHYFSTSRSLGLSLKPGHREMMGGEMVWVGGIFADFMPNGAGFGQFYTEDPETIRLMDEVVAQGGNVFGPDEYQKRLIPADQRADMLERELQTANALIAKLKAQGKIKDQQ